jgi:hypothetical protein
MALALTCACGARFEVEDTLAGQEVACPDCQQPLRAPALRHVPLRTSGYALASTVLVLVGAFTVVGTVLGVLLGVAALVSIARNRERVTGAGFAVFGIVAGILFTTLTALVLSNHELFGIDARVREQTLGRQVDATGPLEVVLPDKGFAITRPSPRWGRVKGNQIDDEAVSRFQENRDLLLVQLARYVFIDVRVVRHVPFLTLDQCQSTVQEDFGPQGPGNPFAAPEDGDRPPVQALLESDRRLPPVGPVEVRESTWQVRSGSRKYTFLVRQYKKPNGPLYIVRGYTQKRRFDSAVKEELERALESFRVLP